MFLPKSETLSFVLEIDGEKLRSVVCISNACSVVHGKDFSFVLSQ